MPLLGGAVKLAGNKIAGAPAFVSDPYSVSSFSLFPTGPNPAFAGIEIDADGGIERNVHTSFPSDIGRWDNGLFTLNKADFQFRLDTIGGSIDVGDATDVWLPASAGLNYWRIEESFGYQIFTGTLRVRLATSPFTEYDSASLTLETERTN